MRRNSQRLSGVVFGAVAGVAVVAGTALATPITNTFTLTDVDWTSTATGGIGGCGGGGSATLSLAGVSGPVTHAYLYWHGIDNCCNPFASATVLWGSKDAVDMNAGAGVGDCDSLYDNPNLIFAGVPVVGTALGDATTNCWGAGSSRAFRADVTALVAGNGLYAVSNLAALPGHDCNGVSLIVTFDDGNPNNNRDLVFFEGNDSNFPEDFPGEDSGWHASLAGINYGSGAVGAQLHLADGQFFDDGPLTFAAGGPPLVVPDVLGRYDGDSVPSAGFSRSVQLGAPGELWDMHTIDLTPLFGAPGPYTLSMDGLEVANDCLGLVLLIIDLEAGSAPIAVEATSWSNMKRIYDR